MIPVPSRPSELGLGFEKFTEWRPQQDEVVQFLLASSKKFMLLEAPTGSGKTLIGTALHKLANLYYTVYCCITKRLQDQYISDFHAFAVDVKGRDNYECLLLPGESASKCIDGEDFDCPLKDECLYRVQVEKARYAEMAVLNNWVFLFQSKFAGRFTNKTGREDEPHRHLLILDEADVLEDCLVDFASREITPKYVERYHLPMPDFEEEEASYWLRWLQEVLNILGSLIIGVPTDEERNKLRVVQQSLNFLYENLDDTWVVEKLEEGINLVPTDISSLAHQYIFNHFDKVLLMSASFCGDRIYTKIMGISPKDYDYIKVPSYFPVHKRPIYYIEVANCTARYERQGSYGEVIKAVDKILDTFPDRTIIHTVSNSRAEQLRKTSRHPIEIYNAQSGKVLMELFEEGTIKVLASPSLERGFDFQGDACRINIITKVPYLVPTKSVEGRQKLYGREWYYWHAVQRIVQMTGRATRSDSDYSLTFILDSEFKELCENKGAGPLFPDWWTAALRCITLEEVKPSLLEEAGQ